jgi:hypothetical protein
MAEIAGTVNTSWNSLYMAGVIAALIAALVFRRNLGASEVPLLTGIIQLQDYCCSAFLIF